MGSENYDKSYDFSSMFNNEFLADVKIKSSSGQIVIRKERINCKLIKKKSEFLIKFPLKHTLTHTQNTKFHVHKSIIWLTLKEKTDTFLSKLSKHNFDSDSLELVLFYCYSGCLPARLDLKCPAPLQPQEFSATSVGGAELLSLGDEVRLKSLVQFLEEYDELGNLNELLRIYMNNFSFKLSKIRNIINLFK